MSNALFPTSLAGLTWDIKPVPTWATVVQKARNRTTTRLLTDPYPLWTFDLTYEFLRGYRLANGATTANPSNFSEIDQIVGFFNARGGAFDDFLLDPAMLTGNPADGLARGAYLGTGDGTTTTFQLQHNLGGFLDEVQNPVGSISLAIGGQVQTVGWTLGAAGVVTIPAAPLAGQIVTADFRWQWRVRFAEDSLNVQGFMAQLYELQSLKLEQVKL